MTEAYRIEEAGTECPACQKGATWDVIGPDDVALGVTYGDYGDADYMARELNNAYEQGRAAAFKILERRIRPDDRRRDGMPDAAPDSGERRLLADGRRHYDSGLPF